MEKSFSKIIVKQTNHNLEVNTFDIYEGISLPSDVIHHPFVKSVRVNKWISERQLTDYLYDIYKWLGGNQMLFRTFLRSLQSPERLLRIERYSERFLEEVAEFKQGVFIQENGTLYKEYFTGLFYINSIQYFYKYIETLDYYEATITKGVSVWQSENKHIQHFIEGECQTHKEVEKRIKHSLGNEIVKYFVRNGDE